MERVALEALGEEEQPWKPQKCDRYYYVLSDGSVEEGKWGGYSCNGRWAFGNVFRTVAEAEFEAERLKVIAEWKRLAEVAPDDGAYDGYRVYICYIDGKIKTYTTNSGYYAQPNELVFYDRLSAEKAIDKIGSDRIKLFFSALVKKNG